jgi:hypothetical protein
MNRVYHKSGSTFVKSRISVICGPICRVFNDLIDDFFESYDDFTKSDFKSFWDDFEIFKIMLKFGDLI